MKIELTFRQSWKTAKPTEMTNEKNESWRALKALIPRIPRPNGTSVITFNKMKVKIGTATFFNFDFRDSLGALLNLTLKSTSSFCKLREEMVTLESATGKSTETSLRWTYAESASKMSDGEGACSDRYMNKMISNENVQKFHPHKHNNSKFRKLINNLLLTGTANAPQAKTTTMALVK